MRITFFALFRSKMAKHRMLVLRKTYVHIEIQYKPESGVAPFKTSSRRTNGIVRVKHVVSNLGTGHWPSLPLATTYSQQPPYKLMRMPHTKTADGFPRTLCWWNIICFGGLKKAQEPPRSSKDEIPQHRPEYGLILMS